MADERDKRDLSKDDPEYRNHTSAEAERWSEKGDAELSAKAGGTDWRRVDGEPATADAKDGETDTAKAQRQAPTDPTSRALGESADQGSDGPHILDRSFSGTYKD